MKCSNKICLMRKEIEEKKLYLEDILKNSVINRNVIKKSQELDELIVECLKCELSSNKLSTSKNILINKKWELLISSNLGQVSIN